MTVSVTTFMEAVDENEEAIELTISKDDGSEFVEISLDGAKMGSMHWKEDLLPFINKCIELFGKEDGA